LEELDDEARRIGYDSEGGNQQAEKVKAVISSESNEKQNYKLYGVV
jgi:hypothetical protein